MTIIMLIPSGLDWTGLSDYFSQIDFMPHGHCYLWKPGLVWTHVISDLLIGISYFVISVCLYILVRKIKIPFTGMVIAFGIFIAACGATHLMEIWNLWHADYWISAWVKVLTAMASVATAGWLLKLQPQILIMAQGARLAEERRVDLESLTRNLENRVNERTVDLSKAIVARDQFLSMASHELKTPLTTMKLLTQMRTRKTVEGQQNMMAPEEAHKYLKNMNDQITRLTSLVDDMLDISHIQRGEFRLHLEMNDICEIIRDEVENFRLSVENGGGTLELETCAPVKVYSDRYRVEQVLDNFLTNAIKYAPGFIVKVKVKVEVLENKVRVSVADQGPGVNEEMREKIFEKFERNTSPNEVSGLGLGLYISKTIITAHNGNIWVDSAEGKGARFNFELPL